MAKKSGGMFDPLIMMAIGALILAVLGIFAPYIGGTVEGSMPTLAVDSEWNATYNTDLPSTADSWGTLQSLLWAAATIMIVIVIIAYLRRGAQG